MKAPKITPDMSNLKWHESNPHQVFNKWRALGDTVGVHTFFKGSRVKLFNFVPPSSLKATPDSSQSSKDPQLLTGEAVPGSLKYDKERQVLWIKSVPMPDVDPHHSWREKHGWIGVTHLQFEGRKVMDARSFYNGYIVKEKGEGSMQFQCAATQ